MDHGQVVADRFEIAERAGVGGMGVVYRALDRASGTVIALKILRSADAARFVREGEVLAKLTHPGIVKYVAAGRLSSGELYLAMEWLEGETLAQRSGGRGSTWRRPSPSGCGSPRPSGSRTHAASFIAT